MKNRKRQIKKKTIRVIVFKNLKEMIMKNVIIKSILREVKVVNSQELGFLKQCLIYQKKVYQEGLEKERDT